MKYYLSDLSDVFNELKSSRDGLSSIEAKKRLDQYGKNELEAPKGKSLFVRFLEQLADPMIIILIVAAIVSGIIAVLENESFSDVIIILVVVLVNAILGVYQENKAEQAIDALQKMSASTSKVLRDNKVMTIASSELVIGDVILLEAGDAVPADARLIESASLKVEESALTGESVPVNKFIDTLFLKDNKDIILAERKNMLYMGCSVAYGRAKAVITSTGMNTEMGKIANALLVSKDNETPLQKKLTELSKILTWIVLGICILVFVVQLIRSQSFNFELVLHSFMIAVSLAVAAIPEGLAAVVTVVLSIGVTNMSKKNAIIRRLTAVETLGCAQIICSDKTGTLTQNKMTVVDYFGDDEKDLSIGMALCSDAEIDEDGVVNGEPTEAALVYYAYKNGLSKLELKKEYIRTSEVPFDSMRKMMTVILQKQNHIIQYTKGAPDVIIDHCTSYIENGKCYPLDDTYRNKIKEENKKMADKALRVLALAKKTYQLMPSEISSEALENDLCFVGLTGMIDPIRPEVKEAIIKCKDAGITPIMITGDHIDTAIAIATELGILDEHSKAITGAMLNEMDDDEFHNRYKDIRVYARVQPEHKTRIVHEWMSNGYITAMTGDGVNDAPSIKEADIGIGMGITGTDVTKNVADMVLADDNFATIVSAVEEGRRIYDNIRKAIQFLLGSNLSEVLCIFIATLLGFEILEPVHLLWINLVTDCFPALALGTEEAEDDIMKRKPRSTHDGIFSNGVGIDIIYQSIAVTALVLFSYFLGHYLESGFWTITNSADGTTMAFLTMSMAEIFHSLNMRSQKHSIFKLKTKNKYLLIAALLSLIATTIVCEVPLLANAFNFTSVSLLEYVIAIGLGFCIIPIVEIVKYIEYK